MKLQVGDVIDWGSFYDAQYDLVLTIDDTVTVLCLETGDVWELGSRDTNGKKILRGDKWLDGEG